MRKHSLSEIIGTGLAIFSMFFGAGNLIFPLQVGLEGGDKTFWGLSGFLITSVLLPLISLITIILFDGNYKNFFKRLGEIPGSLFIAFCMLIIGPFYAMPRIVTFSHIMIAPFLGNIPLVTFSFLFLGLTFLGCYKEGKILEILGKIVSPALLIALSIILIKGFLTAQAPIPSSYASSLLLFWNSIKIGYSTLDVIGAIFFSAIVLSILKQNAPQDGYKSSKHALAKTGFYAGLLGLFLLAIVYIGMGYLGSHFGQGLEHLKTGELFSALSFKIVGIHGAIIIAVAVIMACYSTIVPLTAAFADFIQKSTHHKVGYVTALGLSLLVTGVMSTLGLNNLVDWFKPIINIMYPALITLSICNLAYILKGFRWVKLPVAITLLISTALTIFYSL